MGKGLVPAYAAVIAQQLLGIVGHAVGANALHPDVSRQTVAVLAGGAAAADGLVVANGAVAGIDMHRLAKMHPDVFEDVGKRLADENPSEPSEPANSYTRKWSVIWRLPSALRE